ncbi:unnamed protein product [marine sediment metagenome]|uniref:Uncharacterized protein n=1 Tax=marine sediment metagenome TaxID=412755 RepID=X1G586_9ZZZZ
MAESVEERKSRHIQDILKAHPIYLPDTCISQETAKRLQKLPEQTVFWLWHLARKETPGYSKIEKHMGG